MTTYKPNIQIERLIVYALGKSVFNERFHAGLNIIRGENSSGKSTIMDFLFFGLGGDLFDWREAALNCDAVYLQVKLNGNSVTLARDIEAQGSRPMRIFLGEFSSAAAAGADGWQVYPYARGDKDSFSQVIFRFLGLPEVQIEQGSSKITMNQILRLLYADQISPIDRIFRFQQFDDAITRQAVGDLLCGAYSDKFYQAQVRSIAAAQEFKGVSFEIKNLLRNYATDAMPLTREWVEAERSKLNNEIEAINSEITNIEEKIFHGQFEDRLALNDQQETLARLLEHQAAIARTEKSITALMLEQADSANFIAALEEKLQQLEQSYAVVREFERLDFQFCPSCLEPISDQHVEGACRLCKEPYDRARTRSRALRLVNEYRRQVDQSNELLQLREVELRELRSRLAGEKELWAQAGRHYTVAVGTPSTELRARLRKLNRDAGYLTRQMEDLSRKSAVIAQLEELTEQRDLLQKELDNLSAIISSEKKRNVNRISVARSSIEQITISLLRSDLARQSTFQNAKSVDFEFDGNRVAVNGDSFFSASSMVYLKNSFLVAFLFAAVADPEFGHPRLLIMDTVEDKGMEPERSQNFQILLRDRSERAQSEHQIIIATSMIADELNNSKYTVGEFYTHENRTLA